MFCLHCGAKNGDDSIFCTECGSPLVGTPSDTPMTGDQPTVAMPQPQQYQPSATPQPAAGQYPQYPDNQYGGGIYPDDRYSAGQYAGGQYPDGQNYGNHPGNQYANDQYSYGQYPDGQYPNGQYVDGQVPGARNGTAGSGMPQKGGATAKIVVLVVSIVVVIALVVVGVVLAARYSDAQDDGTTSEVQDADTATDDADDDSFADADADSDDDQDEEEPATSRTLDKDEVDAIVDGYSTTDVAVSVITEDSLRSYSSRNASNQFVAAGLYLPVYLVYMDMNSGQSDSTSNQMMGSMSNDAANAMIEDIGGLSALNSWLSDERYSSTTFGRLFGDVEASEDGYENYTSSDDAARMLAKVIASGAYTRMNYDIVSEGVTVPGGATVHAHRGMGIQDAYNYFVVISDGEQAVGVAVMTEDLGKNEAAALTSDILENVWDTMFEGQ